MFKIFITSLTIPRRMETFNSYVTVALYHRRESAMSLMFALITNRKNLDCSLRFNSPLHVRDQRRLSCALGAFRRARRKLDMLKSKDNSASVVVCIRVHDVKLSKRRPCCAFLRKWRRLMQWCTLPHSVDVKNAACNTNINWFAAGVCAVSKS
jgi:hypothetical protein